MDIRSVIGVRIRNSLKKTGSRTYFFTEKWYGGHGASSFLFILDGKAVFDFKNASAVGVKGDLVCWDHGEARESSLVPGNTLSFHMLVFDLASRDIGKLTLSNIGFPHLIKMKRTDRIEFLFSRIHTSFTGRGRCHLQECSRLALELLEQIQEGKLFPAAPATEKKGWMDARIRETLEYLGRYYKRAIDVPTLARKACMHPSYFARLFKRETGLSPYQYVLEFKIRKAQDFFLDYGYAPERQYISNELGFHDYSHFYRTFSKVAGMTPSQFVKKYRTPLT